MKAFVVTILAPDRFVTQDILIACNIGIKEHAKQQSIELSPMDYHTMVHTNFDLKEITS